MMVSGVLERLKPTSANFEKGYRGWRLRRAHSCFTVG